jgi:hypothetical protein
MSFKDGQIVRIIYDRWVSERWRGHTFGKIERFHEQLPGGERLYSVSSLKKLDGGPGYFDEGHLRSAAFYSTRAGKAARG